MKDLAQAASVVQIIRCDFRDLSFGIDKDDVLSIQRPDRVVFRGDPDFPDGQEALAKFENPDEVVGWLSDGVRRIPIVQLSKAQFGGAPSDEVGKSTLAETARVILFAPITSDRGQSPQAGSPPWGLIVDRVVGMIEAPHSSFHSAPWILQDPIKPTFRSVVRMDDQVLMLLNARSVGPFHDRLAAEDGPLHQLMVEKAPLPKEPVVQSSGQLNDQLLGKPGSKGIIVFSLREDLPDNRCVSLGLSISQVPEIFETSMMVDVPAGPEYLQGLVFWREIPVPVIDIAARLGFDPSEIPAPSNSRRFIIARHKYHPDGPSQKNGGRQRNRETSDALTLYAAFEIRSDVRILRLPIESKLSTRSLPIKPGMVLGQVELEAETLVIPDLKAVLSQDME